MRKDRAMKRRARTEQPLNWSVLFGALAVVAFLILCMSIVRG